MHVNTAVFMKRPAWLCATFAGSGSAMDAAIHQDHISLITLFVLNIRKLLYTGDYADEKRR